ncbi:MAG: hypothetical protein HY870_12110 [Chloroflexi bacterium]|nr:hypothetical protein [Chloroflexota bacterium]
MSQTIGLVMFAGGERGTHPLLGDMRRIRQACARDALERAVSSHAYQPMIVATDDARWADSLGDLPISIDLDPPDRPFHFGQRLAEIVAHHDLQRILYLGAAACPLLATDQFKLIADTLEAQDLFVIANNIHSTDWAAITPAAIVADWIDRLGTDNGLGWVLSNDAGLTPMTWPVSPATRLDIDVPIDAQIAALHPACGPHLRRVMTGVTWSDVRLRAAREVIRTRASRLILIGRVPAWAWAQLEKSAQCWTRVYSEERGMRAAGRLGSGQVRSLLNDHLTAVGLPKFMAELSDMTDAILWDTRVLWAARGLWPSEIDRSAADLGLVDFIDDPFIRDFTQAIHDAPIPIVTGGHALVSGGLWALLESMPGA